MSGTKNQGQDLIVELIRGKTPKSDDDYICLGHFDLASVTWIDEKKGVNKFSTFKADDADDADDANDEKQRNYLIASDFFCVPESHQNFNFTFMMTLSLKNEEIEASLKTTAESLNEKLKKSVGSASQIWWSIYYPVARGDIIVMLYSERFIDAINHLYSFASNDEEILYSYTIPMIRYGWLKEESHDKTPCDKAIMRWRVTVKDYTKMNSFVDAMKSTSGTDLIVQQETASYGTDDIQIDFGKFSEKKLADYLEFILTEDNQNTLRDSVAFSAELDVLLILDQK